MTLEELEKEYQKLDSHQFAIKMSINTDYGFYSKNGRLEEAIEKRNDIKKEMTSLKKKIQREGRLNIVLEDG